MLRHCGLLHAKTFPEVLYAACIYVKHHQYFQAYRMTESFESQSTSDPILRGSELSLFNCIHNL